MSPGVRHDKGKDGSSHPQRHTDLHQGGEAVLLLFHHQVSWSMKAAQRELDQYFFYVF
jgi:hypothetical protein